MASINSLPRSHLSSLTRRTDLEASRPVHSASPGGAPHVLARTQPVTVDIPHADLADLQERVARSRFDRLASADNWRAKTDLAICARPGCPLATLEWRAQERALNAMPHRTAAINGQRVHYVHLRGASATKSAAAADPRPRLAKQLRRDAAGCRATTARRPRPQSGRRLRCHDPLLARFMFSDLPAAGPVNGTDSRRRVGPAHDRRARLPPLRRVRRRHRLPRRRLPRRPPRRARQQNPHPPPNLRPHIDND